MPTQSPITSQIIPASNLLRDFTSRNRQSKAKNRWRREFSRFVVLAVAAGSTLATALSASAQGGGNANAIGISIQNSANTAAATQNSAAMNSAAMGSSAAGSGSAQYAVPPGMSTEMPSSFIPGDPSAGGAAYSAEMGSAGMGSAGMGSAEMYSGAVPGGYGMPTGPGGRPAQLGMQGMMFSAGGSYLGSIAEFLNRPLSPDAVKFRPTLAEQAALAFHYGDQRKAIALYQSHLIAERESASQGLDAIRYNPLARRPVWAIRIGVSIHPRVADAFVEDPQPIREGDVATAPTNRGGRNAYGGQGTAGQMAGGAGSMEMAAPTMATAAGMPAAGMIGAAGSEMGSAGMMDAAGMMGADGMMMGSEGMMGAAGGQPAKAAPVVNPAIAAAAAADKTLDSHLGMIADLVKSQLTTRFSSGKFGSVLPGLAAKGPAVAEIAEKSGLAISPGSNGSIMMWIPGIDFVGSGDANSMIGKCRENGIDVLLHFDVIVKDARGEPQYDARCRLINCAIGENISVSKSINKRDVLISARKRGNAAVIAELMQPVFDGLDSKVVAMAMPPLQPQHAVARIDSLLAKPDITRPENLAELVMFHHKRLIDDDQFEQVMFFAAGENGLKLIHGAPEERAELANTLVERQLGVE